MKVEENLRDKYHLQKLPGEGSFPGQTWERDRYHQAVVKRLSPQSARPA